jgi:acyl-CoA dehydrogenase
MLAMAELIFVLSCIAAVFLLAMRQSPLWLWALAAAAAVLLWQTGLFTDGELSWPELGPLTALAWLPAILLGALSVPSIRRATVVAPVFGIIRKTLPTVSDTEKQALDAGTVGWDAELFSGRPDFAKLRAVPPVTLSREEQEFLEGPTEEFCRMIDDWQIRHNEKEIPEHVWRFACERGFLGMLISKQHGGLGFSAQAQSLILGKISSRSPEVATIVMVPNSLGPGELIEKYGTDEQKHHYLPRLAKGLEIPCFGLTGPTSGSDAATMRDIGTVTKGMHEGREVVGIKLSWEKRYITLGPKATLLGLAFRLFDPENLLGKGSDLGITVALIPTRHAGVQIGRRHLPSGSAFPNGPNWGEDVFIPLDWIIGGEKMAGQGWRMLMECLAAGRSISLPSSSTAGAKAMLRFTSAYSRIRKQFALPIGKMEGIEEPLAKLVEHAYVLEAARGVTASMVARGEKPSVISALLKYQSTERLRECVNAAMDIHGGRGICDGPSNYLQSGYQMVPVGITVEGANILTRSLITFAQGALRAHPYLYKEIAAAQEADGKKGLMLFERAFGAHVAFSVSNAFGALFHNLTFGAFAPAPDHAFGTSQWYRQLYRGSRNFALVADLTVGLLGGGLKTKQRLTGRMADALSELYLLSCVLKRFEDDGKYSSDRLIVDYTAKNHLHRFEQAIRGTIDNFPVEWARPLMRVLVFPLGARAKPASDSEGKRIVSLVLEPSDVRDRLTRHMFVSKDPHDPTGLLEVALPKVIAAEAVERKVEKAIRQGEIQRYHGKDWIGDAVRKEIITASEGSLLREAEDLMQRVIAVDHFDPEEVKPHYRLLSNTTRRVVATPASRAAE